VKAAAEQLGVRYPIVQDNGFDIWKRYGIWARPIFAPAPIVNCTGHKFLSGARLALDQYRRLDGRHLLDVAQQLSKRGALTDDRHPIAQTDALKHHWPEYPMEGTCLGLFMI
jgi:hypothetical protein